jgi:hypothetical protein
MSNEQTPSTTPIKWGWRDLGFHLIGQVHYELWRDAPWLGTVITQNDDEPGRLQAYRLVEAPYVHRIESAVQRWLDTADLPLFEPPAHHLFALRFATVGELFMSFDGILRAPSEPEVYSVYKSFLIDWWRDHGATYAVGFSCADYDIHESSPEQGAGNEAP